LPAPGAPNKISLMDVLGSLWIDAAGQRGSSALRQWESIRKG
jgi:hypothetical protein